ncbi:MAG: glycosyltransferase family 2 protein [Bacteroidetes bacterium]|nr:MAG: glycosyltransferase family 2 protein [Bacteroidota bacterium]TAF93583.1 MAG: glycosyltransferase family 2 protein [Bacteroidota bacterium]
MPAMFALPKWIHEHLYANKNFADLTPAEIEHLRNKISKFKHDEPDVSIMIPAWNEMNNIYRALSSLSSNETTLKVELCVVNNNSKDKTQEVLDLLGVRSYLQPEQGTPHARQMGLEKARGKYHLCADSDTFYPPKWIDHMVKPLMENKGVVGVYGRYAFIPPPGSGRFGLWFYEQLTGVLINMKKKNREHLNVLGYNMGFITKVGLESGGFKVREVRKGTNEGSDYIDMAEDGQMALNLLTQGRLQMVSHPDALVFTSPRRLLMDGGVVQAFWNRTRLHISRMGEYVTGKYKKDAKL